MDPTPFPVNANDLLIIGGGVTGVLTALAATEAGLDWILVEAEGLGAGQSNHSHGYLHHGYAYIDGSPELIAALQHGSQHWATLLSQLHVGPVTTWSSIIFANPFNALGAARKWTRLGLPVEEAPMPKWLPTRYYSRAYRTGEKAYNFYHAFRTLAATLPEERILRGTVLKLYRSGDRVSGVDVQAGHGLVRLQARHVVLAAGVQNEELVKTVTKHRGRAVTRTSYMLVLRSPNLPRASVICPEADSYGAFVVSRMDKERVVWLVSNFLSYAELIQTHVAGHLWTRATLRTLQHLYPWASDPALECGVYPAPKMELRAAPGVLAPHVAERFGLTNLVVAAPTKITLAPLLAQDTINRVRRGAPFLGTTGTPALEYIKRLGSSVKPTHEHWKSLDLQPMEQFLENPGSVTTGSVP